MTQKRPIPDTINAINKEDDKEEYMPAKKRVNLLKTALETSSSKGAIHEGIGSPVASTSQIVAKIESSICEEKESSRTLPKTIENGLYLSKVECLGAEANQRALSLFELIRVIRPIASIHFNFCIDPGWMLRQYTRSLRQCPISFIVGQRGLAELHAECAQWPNVQCAGAPLPFAYGTHHAKLSLFESERALHVVVSTANLVAEDWALKTQAFYHFQAPFPMTSTSSSSEAKKERENGDKKSGRKSFKDDLVEYLRRAYPKSSGKAHQLVAYWLDRIEGGQPDFSQCKDRLIGSIPGRYYKSQDELSKFGHMKLRSLLAEKFSAQELKANKTFIGQFSSLGSLGARPELWLCDEFLTSLSCAKSLLPPTSLRLIYPTVENVRQSLEGYAAGLSLPYTMEVHKKQQYLRSFLHQWKSDRLQRTQAMPHVKSYTALDDQGAPQWLVVTSANMSGSAWGKLEKCGDQLFIRSYELGVLQCAKDHPEGLLLPFDLPLTKYGANDEPFMVDMRYGKFPPDANGFKGACDVREAALSS